VRFTPEQLSQIVPISVREELGKADKHRRINFFFFDAKRIPDLDARLRLAEFLQLDEKTQLMDDLGVCLALNRDYAKSAEFEERSLNNEFAGYYPAPKGMHRHQSIFYEIRWWCWSQRSLGRAEQGAAGVEDWIRKGAAKCALVDADPTKQGDLVSFRLEQARCFAAAGAWDKAEWAIDTCLRDYPRPITAFTFYTQPYLLKGFLLARKGDDAGAREFWTKGLYPAYLKQLPVGVTPDSPFEKAGWALVDYWIMASLTNNLSDETAKKISKSLMSGAAADTLVAQAVPVISLSPATMRNVWHTKRSRELARDLAFLSLEPKDHFASLMCVALYQEFRESLYADKPSADEEEACWRTVHDGFNALNAGKIGKAQALQLAFAWKGTSGFFGWSGVAPELAPELRRPIAYLLGVRYLRLERPAEAAGMFRTAMADAPPDVLISRLARAELDRLGKK